MMNLKKLLSITLIISIIAICLPKSSFADSGFLVIDGQKGFIKDGIFIPIPSDIPDSIKISGKAYNINYDIFMSKGFVVYGSHSNITDNDSKKDSKGNLQYRYLGYDINGNAFSNIDFPNDINISTPVWEKKWIKDPWDYDLCRESTYNTRKEEGKSYLEYIQYEGEYWWDKKDSNGITWTPDKLISYFNIMSPVGDYTPGTARGWHLYNGNKYYQTFILMPQLIDLQAKITSYPKTATTGSTVKVTGKASCYGINAALVKGKTSAAWYVNNVMVAHDDNYTIDKERDWTININMPAEGAEVKFILNYNFDKPENEVGFGYDNNDDTVKIAAVAPTPTPTPVFPSTTPGTVNLKAKIINAPDSAYKDSNVSVMAEITSEGVSQAFETTVVWKVNGTEVARNEHFVFLGSRKSVIGVKIPSGGSTVEVTVNPAKNKPSTEKTYTDNSDKKTISVKADPGNDPGGDITVSVAKVDGSNTLAVHPQWRVDSTKQLQTKSGASWNEVFERGNVDKNSYPQLAGKWNQTADFDYLNNTLAAGERKFNVTVNYKWTQTYHQEWKVVRTYTDTVTDYKWDPDQMKYVVAGSHKETRHEYGWVKVADPAPKAKINLTVKTSGTIATQVAYNIASGEDAEISTEEKNTSETASATLNANSSKAFTFTMPAFAQLYPNAYSYFDSSDDGKAFLTASVSASVASTTCSSCGDTITYTQPKSATNTKTITIKACSVYSKSTKLGWNE